MKKKKIESVLFVCTGNSCRSVMAEGLLKKYLSEKKRSEVTVLSCGTAASPDMPPTNNTVRVMKNEGIDVAGYRSSILSKELIDKSDLILVMQEIHKFEATNLVPKARDKVYLLKEYVKQGSNVEGFFVIDPIGKPLEVYEMVLADIKVAVKALLKKIV